MKATINYTTKIVATFLSNIKDITWACRSMEREIATTEVCLIMFCWQSIPDLRPGELTSNGKGTILASEMTQLITSATN